MTSRRLAAAAVALCVAGLASAQPPGFSEYDIKAGFLYNFAKLIEWPASTPRVLTLCIVGDDPFGAAKQAIQGKAVGDRSLAVRLGVPKNGLQECQIVFVARSDSDHAPALLLGVRDGPVLTVGDEAGLAARGLVASFYRDGDKVRFEINVDAAHRAHLPISSRLLNLARLVHDQEAVR